MRLQLPMLLIVAAFVLWGCEGQQSAKSADFVEVYFELLDPPRTGPMRTKITVLNNRDREICLANGPLIEASVPGHKIGIVRDSVHNASKGAVVEETYALELVRLSGGREIVFPLVMDFQEFHVLPNIHGDISTITLSAGVSPIECEYVDGVWQETVVANDLAALPAGYGYVKSNKIDVNLDNVLADYLRN